ncbi:MAG: RNA-directed DNA polymerase [bacterium]
MSSRRPGFGQHRAVLRAQALMRRYGWVCHLDVRAFFPSVDLDVMRALIADRIADERVLGVIDLILADGARIYREPEVRAYAGLGDDWPPPGRGLPIGAATSQYLAVHVYLNGLDHHVKRALKVPGYLRYGDDLAIFGRGRAEVKAWRAAIGEWLWQARGLRLKHPEAPVLRTAGHLDWLGYRITRDGRAPHGRAQRRLLRRLRAELRGAGAVQIERSVASSAGVMLF